MMFDRMLCFFPSFSSEILHLYDIVMVYDQVRANAIFRASPGRQGVSFQWDTQRLVFMERLYKIQIIITMGNPKLGVLIHLCLTSMFMWLKDLISNL